jgi:hypothetical protein
VVAIVELLELRGRPDDVHFAAALDQRRAIVTRDLGDFRPLMAAAMRSGTSTFGLVCVSRRFPSSRDGVGPVVRALAALLESDADDDAIVKLGGEVWLDAP